MRGGAAGGGMHGMDDGITGGVPYGVVQCGRSETQRGGNSAMEGAAPRH